MVGGLSEVAILWFILFSTPMIHLRRRQGVALPETSAAYPAKFSVCAVSKITGIPSCFTQIQTGDTVIDTLEPELSINPHL
jgi:hypothetical protein